MSTAFQQIFCRACGAFAFEYDGDVREGCLSSSKAIFADGHRPALGSSIEIPCGHSVRPPAHECLRIGGEN